MGETRKRQLARWLPATIVAVAALLLVVACNTVNRSVVVPGVPGAEFAGSKACEECHADRCREFKTAAHARLVAQGPNAMNVGCESCHGPSRAHAESGGDRRTAYSYAPGRAPLAFTSTRPLVPRPRPSVENCFECHLDKRAAFEARSHHPVMEGKMKCGDCHEPHKGPAVRGGGTALLAENDNCTRCHTTQRGPFVFEHEALREGCATCHDPHGSVNAKLLVLRDNNLCLKCHVQQARGGRVVIGGSDHTVRVSQGACWTAGCHEAVHGSRVNSSLRF